MKKVIVTGGSGFIGSNLINFLLKRNLKVINIDIFSYASSPDRFKNYYKNKNYLFLKKNISDFNSLKKLISKNKIECIFNLASNSHVDRSIDNPANFVKENIESNLFFFDNLKFLKKKNYYVGKFINISTDEVYGSIMGLPSLENSNLNPNSPYSASKASIELILRAFGKTFEFPYINVRCCNNYGPYQFPEKFIPTIITNILKGKNIPIYGDGKNTREWIYVDDFCNSLYQIYRKGQLFETYNVGSTNRLTNINLTQKIIKNFQLLFDQKELSSKVTLVKDRPGHDRSYKVNSNKIRKQLKWKNNISLDLGLTKTIKWYLDNLEWLRYTQKVYNGKRLGKK